MADGFVPPQAVRNNAKRGLELREKHGRGGTAIGVARARDLSNGASLSLSTIKRMVSYFARHEVDKKGEGWGSDSAGYIAWLLWGGDAGRSWANGIARQQETKEKSTVNDLTTAFFEIVKADKRDDGTLMVYGKATDDSLDIDQQICDPLWLDRAMPEWFKSGGNIREQHSSIAAGVAKEYEKKADGHYIHALVVDPISVKKVDNGVLKGFSIGIKSPRVVRDQKAANGRIIDGQIVEVSLVDRPANPNCQLVLAKSVDGETGIWKTEELIEKEQTREANGRFGASTSPKEESGIRDNGVVRDLQDKLDDHVDSLEDMKSDDTEFNQRIDEATESLQNAQQEMDSAQGRIGNKLEAHLEYLDNAYSHLEDAVGVLRGTPAESIGASIRSTAAKLTSYMDGLDPSNKSASIALQLSEIADDSEKRALLMKNAQELIELSKSIAPADIVKFDQKLYDDARRALAQLIVVEANEMDAGSNEEMSIAHLLSAVHHLLAWYGGEVAEGEVMDHVEEDIELAAKPEDKPEEDAEEKCAECGKMGKMCKCSKEEDPDMEKSSEPTEVVTELEDQELPAEAPAEEASTEEAEEKVSEGSDLTEEIEAIVEKAIKSATESLESKISELVTAKEAAIDKAVGLESELAVAKSLAVAGGPKRTIKPVDHSTNDLLVKAATYKAKADASTDPDLAKGYALLAKKFFAEADTITKSN